MCVNVCMGNESVLGVCLLQVSDWWEQYVYLRGRAPIMINSNYYGIVRLCDVDVGSGAVRSFSGSGERVLVVSRVGLVCSS